MLFRKLSNITVKKSTSEKKKQLTYTKKINISFLIKNFKN